MRTGKISPWNRQDLGKTYLLLLAEPFLKKTSLKDEKELWKLPTSSLYRHLAELEKLGPHFRKGSEIPEEIGFYVGVSKAMQKRRIPGTPNPAGILTVLYGSFNFLKHETKEGLELHRSIGIGLMWLAAHVLYNRPPSKILKLCDKTFGNHSLQNVCIALLLLAQANPIVFEQPNKKKPVNFERQLKRRGLYLGEPQTEKIYSKHFV